MTRASDLEEISEGESMPHQGGDSRVALRAKAGDILELQGTGETVFQWLPKDKQAMEIEVRARLVGALPGAILTPLIYWRVDLSHGKRVWNEPEARIFPTLAPPPAPAFLKKVPQLYILPARGLLFRVACRELKIYFSAAGYTTGDPINTAKVAVSAQPVVGGEVPPAWFPRTVYAHAPSTDVLQALPIEAHEMRVRQAFSVTDVAQPFAPATQAVEFIGIFGQLLSVVDAAKLADWQPIPMFAESFVVSTNMQVEYR